MIKIRKGVFETNSSSVHSLVISLSKAEPLDDAFTVEGGEYGWGYEKLLTPKERLDYLWQGIWDGTNKRSYVEGSRDEWQDRIRAWLPNVEFADLALDQDEEDDYWYSAIDHVGELFPFINRLWEDDELLGYFLTDPESHVIVSNDNSDSYGFEYPKGSYIEYRKGN